jgi:ATP-binding cassette subfamily C (CFTR/MRP) protein 1
VATFRAFGWVEDSLEVNNKLLDNSQRPAYLLTMIQGWLIFILNLVIAVIAILVVVLATQIKSTTRIGFTGASLITLMSFGGFISGLIVTYTQLETSIGAISRLKSFSEKVGQESLPGEDIVPPQWWPSSGAIEIRGVSASYA